MKENVRFSLDPSQPAPALRFHSPEELARWTAERLDAAVQAGQTEITLPCWTFAGSDWKAAGAAYQILKAVMDRYRAAPRIRSLTLCCATPEDLRAFQFQWNMWYAEEKLEFEHA